MIKIYHFYGQKRKIWSWKASNEAGMQITNYNTFVICGGIDRVSGYVGVPGRSQSSGI